MKYTTHFRLHSQAARLAKGPLLQCLVDAQEAIVLLAKMCEAFLFVMLARGSHPPRQPVPRHFWLQKSFHARICALGHEENETKNIAVFFGLFHATTHALCRCGFKPGLVPVHSPLLRESWLVSFPPLSDMLKFSG